MKSIPFYMYALYCVFKMFFFPKNYLKAISKVHVNLCPVDGKVKFDKVEG